MTACAVALLLAIAAMAYYSTTTTSAGATTQGEQGAKKFAATQVALTDPQCAEAYRELRDGKYSFSLANARDGCQDQFASYVKLVRTDYAIKGGALFLKDSTHSLVGMSIRKGETKVFPFHADQAPAIIAENGGKIVATMMFGNAQEFDVAFKLLSEAIASASGRCAKC